MQKTCVRAGFRVPLGEAINRSKTTLQRYWCKWALIWWCCIGNTGECHFLVHSCYFQHFKMSFMKYWSLVKLFSKTRSTFWEKFFYIRSPLFDVWRHLLTSFCNISLIWSLNHLFEQLDLLFTKYIWRVKLLNVTLGTFWQNIYLIPCRVFDLWRHLLTSFCSISLILPLKSSFE